MTKGKTKSEIKQEYGEFLDGIEWDYFCTFTTPYELTLKSARRLSGRIAKAVNIPRAGKMFWGAEKFECKDGYHIHALIQSSVPKRVLWAWYKDRYGRNSISNYDTGRRGSEYVTKYVAKELSDWDLM